MIEMSCYYIVFVCGEPLKNHMKVFSVLCIRTNLLTAMELTSEREGLLYFHVAIDKRCVD